MVSREAAMRVISTILSALLALMKISVIVCTRNRVGTLLQCLESIDIAARNAALKDTEIIVLDNGSTDNTSLEVKTWALASYLPVVVGYEGRPGLSVGRNRGVGIARGDFFVMVDDDCNLREDYFAELFRLNPDTDELVLRGGRVELGNSHDLPLTIKTEASARRWHLAMASARKENLGNCFFGCNLLMSRAVYSLLGPFDENLGAGGPIPAGDDADYVFRAYQASVALEYVPDLVVFHHHGRRSAVEARKLLRNYMVGSGALYAKHFIRCPSLCLQAMWDVRNAVREVVSRTNLFHPEYNFSHVDKLLCYVTGAALYLYAIVKGIARTQRKPSGS
jgi:glycosyltransferase involved in cell wall biosynthesis